MVLDDGQLVAGRSAFLGMLLWCVLLSLIGLAISATVKRRVAAAAVILCLYFGGAGLAGAINLVMGIESGALFDLAKVVANHLGGPASIRQRLQHDRLERLDHARYPCRRFVSGS